jgi:hypothetical protein
MNRLLWFALAAGLCLQPAAVHVQTTFPTQPHTNPIPGQTLPSVPGTGNPIPPAQSLAPTPSICGAGGEGVRVCDSDFQSCSSVCAASVFDPNADTSACAARCCTNLVTCLSIRQCSTSGINCFSLPGTLGITQEEAVLGTVSLGLPFARPPRCFIQSWLWGLSPRRLATGDVSYGAPSKIFDGHHPRPHARGCGAVGRVRRMSA